MYTNEDVVKALEGGAQREASQRTKLDWSRKRFEFVNRIHP